VAQTVLEKIIRNEDKKHYNRM